VNLTGHQLRALFKKFNAEYFDGELRTYSLRAYMTSLGQDGRCLKLRRRIEIRSTASAEEATSILLHEMAHAAPSEYHDMSWKKEMIRLRDAGAPLISPNLAFVWKIGTA
jgi:hypothetical protein